MSMNLLFGDSARKPGRACRDFVSAVGTKAPSGSPPMLSAGAMWRIAALLLAMGAMWSCADCFFSIKGRVVECGTTTPIAQASISVRTDKGIHEGTYPKTFATDESGDFEVTNDATEVCGAVQTLTFTKDGFAPMSTQVTGAADSAPIELCMTRN